MNRALQRGFSDEIDHKVPRLYFLYSPTRRITTQTIPELKNFQNLFPVLLL